MKVSADEIDSGSVYVAITWGKVLSIDVEKTAINIA